MTWGPGCLRPESRGEAGRRAGTRLWTRLQLSLNPEDFARSPGALEAQSAPLSNSVTHCAPPCICQQIIPHQPTEGPQLLRGSGPTVSSLCFASIPRVVSSNALNAEKPPSCPRGGAAGSLQPALVVCFPPPSPCCSSSAAAAVPSPLWSRFSTAGSENNGYSPLMCL